MSKLFPKALNKIGGLFRAEPARKADFPSREKAYGEKSPAVLSQFPPSPFPCLLLEGSAVLEFSDFFKENVQKPEKITDIIPAFAPERERQNAFINGKPYAAYTSSFRRAGNLSELTLVYFVEILPGSAIKESIAAALIFIDNYEEANGSIEDVRRPLLQAVVDRKLNNLAQQLSGIIRKFEKDRYLLVFTSEKLEILKNDRFSILGNMREIDMGNKIPVTLSIGIGVNGETPAQSMEYARAALDLALGRGGDQALIKNGENYLFFGGVSREAAANPRVRARVKAYALSGLIDQADNVLVMGHKNIDFDCLGAAIGIRKFVVTHGQKADIIIGDSLTNVSSLYQRLVYEKDYKDVFITPEQAYARITEKTLLVAVDTHRPSLLEAAGLLKHPLLKSIVVIDHHRKSAEFIANPALVYHEPYASSACELVTEMLQYANGDVRLSAVEADSLLAGITMDTKNFVVKTGARTFESAAYLKRLGADSTRVRLLLQGDLLSYQAKAETVSRAKIIEGGFAVSITPPEIENASVIAAQAADELLFITGIKASFVVTPLNGHAQISARSLGEVNVQVIMEKIGGGGHQTVAGAQIEGVTPEEAAKTLEAAIFTYLEEVRK